MDLQLDSQPMDGMYPQVGNLFSRDLARRAPAPSAQSTGEEAPGTPEAPPIPEEYLSETTLRFGECLDNLVEVLWSFHLRLQLVHVPWFCDDSSGSSNFMIFMQRPRHEVLGRHEAVVDRYNQLHRLVDDSSLQREKMSFWDHRRRQLLQSQDEIRAQKDQNHRHLSQLEFNYEELRQEYDLLRQRSSLGLRAHQLHLAAAAERRILDDLYHVEDQIRVLQQKQALLLEDEDRVNANLQTLERDMENFRLSLQPQSLQGSQVRPRPESAPRFRSTMDSYQAGSLRPSRIAPAQPSPQWPPTWDNPVLGALGRDLNSLTSPVRQQSAPQHSLLKSEPRIQPLPGLATWKPTASLGSEPGRRETAAAFSPSPASSTSPVAMRTSPISSPVAQTAPVLPVVAPPTEAADAAMASLGSPEMRSDPLRERLEEHELQELQVLGDGNCQFRALADQLAPYYDQRYHDQVRAVVVHQLRAYPERYRPFVTEDYDEWVDRMAADKEWGTEVTLRAAADAFGAEIHVFADNLGEGQLYSAYEPSEKKMSKLVRLVFRSNRGDSGHYNSAVFLGDVFRLAHWSLRLLGLSQPWPLRRRPGAVTLHDFALSSLELLLEQGEDLEGSRAAAKTWLTESCSFYLGVPVIPRMQSRMRNCLHALRRGNWFSSSVLDELLNLETDSSDFDATGSNLQAFRAEDPMHSSFQRLIREAVIGRVDRSCHLDCRQQGLKAQCSAPLNCSAWTKSRRCQLLLEVLNSVPQEPRQRVLQLLDEETPDERAMQSEIQRQLSNRNPESNFAFCSSVCSGKPGPD
eukprot:s50_g50.t2